MSKYIDAEKLIAEIERLLKCTELHRGDAVVDGSRQTLYWIKDFIASLSQEQPENEEKIMNFFDALGDCGFSQHDMLLIKTIWKEAVHSQVADASKMEQPDMNIEWFRLAEDYTMHLDFSYCKTCDWMLHIWKKGCGEDGKDLIIFEDQDTVPNLLLARGAAALKEWLLENNVNAALTPR